MYKFVGEIYEIRIGIKIFETLNERFWKLVEHSPTQLRVGSSNKFSTTFCIYCENYFNYDA